LLLAAWLGDDGQGSIPSSSIAGETTNIIDLIFDTKYREFMLMYITRLELVPFHSLDSICDISVTLLGDLTSNAPYSS
jgi:hypothetical protein